MPTATQTERTAREAKRDSRQADGRASFSLALSALALMASGMSAWTANRALDFNRKTSAESQRATLFWQFQGQYNAVSGRFPPQLLNSRFQPADGSEAYAKLEAYWMFCFAEYYATHQVNPEAFGELWDGYYVPLIADSLEIPSLRFVLEDMIVTDKLKRGDWNKFLVEMARIARLNDIPLGPAAERKVGELKQSASGN